MKSMYKRKAWLLDEGVLVEGYTAKKRFYPNDFGCGFSSQKFKKRDIGLIIFYDKKNANKTLYKHTECCGVCSHYNAEKRICSLEKVFHFETFPICDDFKL